MPVVIVSTYFDDIAKTPYVTRNGDLLILTQPSAFTAVEKYVAQTAKKEEWERFTNSPEHTKLLSRGIHMISLNTPNANRVAYHVTKDQEIDVLLGIAHRLANTEKRAENWMLIMMWADGLLIPKTTPAWSDLLSERYRAVNTVNK